MKKIVFFIILIALPALASNEVETRTKRFQENKSNMKSIFESINFDDFPSIIDAASDISSWANEMASFFPEGSESRGASNEIWVNFDDFKLAASNNKDAADKLITFAKNSDMKQVKIAFKELSATCKSCHRKFKN